MNINRLRSVGTLRTERFLDKFQEKLGQLRVAIPANEVMTILYIILVFYSFSFLGKECLDEQM